MNGSRHMKTYAKAVRMSLLAALSAILLLAFSACGRQQAADPGTALNQSPSPASGNVHQAGQDDGIGNKQDIEVSQNIADAVAELGEVKTANVLVADNSAYVAVVLESGAGEPLGASPSPGPSPGAAQGAATTPAAQTDGLSDDLKNRIAQKAQAVNTNIKRVYVSASPDFVQRMNTFRQDIQNGRPVSGFIKEFYTVVERLFPTRAGQNNPVVTP